MCGRLDELLEKHRALQENVSTFSEQTQDVRSFNRNIYRIISLLCVKFIVKFAVKFMKYIPLKGVCLLHVAFCMLQRKILIIHQVHENLFTVKIQVHENVYSWSGLPRHRENREFESPFFQTERTQGIC